MAEQKRYSKSSASKPIEADEDRQDVIWAFVPLADYNVPKLPSRSALANAWKYCKRLFRSKDEESSMPGKQETKLQALPQDQLERLVAFLDWQSAVAALDESLCNWLAAAKPDARVMYVVGQPYNGHSEIVRLWGERYQAMKIASPSYDEILTNDARWFDNWPQKDQLWVMPNLEHCYLRHPNGLKLVRRLFEDMEQGKLGKGVIGCDSWAWAYFQHIWPVSQPEALTLRDFDGHRLAHFFLVWRLQRQIDESISAVPQTAVPF